MYEIPAIELEQPLQIAHVDTLQPNRRGVVRDAVSYYAVPNSSQKRRRVDSPEITPDVPLPFEIDEQSENAFGSPECTQEDVLESSHGKQGTRVFVSIVRSSIRCVYGAISNIRLGTRFRPTRLEQGRSRDVPHGDAPP